MTTEVRIAINVEAKWFDVICVCNDPTIYAYVSVLAFKVNHKGSSPGICQDLRVESYHDTKTRQVDLPA